MPDFGKDGTRKVTVSHGGATLRRSGGESDYLHYKLTVEGANPIFSLTSEKDNTIWSNDQFPAPQQNYDRKWPKDDSEIEGNDISYALVLSFFNANKYT